MVEDDVVWLRVYDDVVVVHYDLLLVDDAEVLIVDEILEIDIVDDCVAVDVVLRDFGIETDDEVDDELEAIEVILYSERTDEYDEYE